MSRILGPGTKGIDVRELQMALNYQLASAACQLPVDGAFGPATRHAVQVFQRRVGLTPDGIVGDQTRGKLFTTYTVQITVKPTAPATTPPPAPTARTATSTPARSPSTTAPPSAADSDGPPTPTKHRGWENVQLQPGAQHTFRPWYFAPDPTKQGAPDPFFSTTFTIQGTYRWFNRDASKNWTREGAHLEIAPGLQFGYNTAYSLPYRGGPLSPWGVQASVQFTYADFLAYNRLHLSPFGQITAQAGPGSIALGAGVGGQFSVDLISDRLSLFLQGTAAANVDPRNGQVQIGPNVMGGLIWTIYPGSKKSREKK